MLSVLMYHGRVSVSAMLLTAGSVKKPDFRAWKLRWIFFSPFFESSYPSPKPPNDTYGIGFFYSDFRAFSMSPNRMASVSVNDPP